MFGYGTEPAVNQTIILLSASTMTVVLHTAVGKAWANVDHAQMHLLFR